MSIIVPVLVPLLVLAAGQPPSYTPESAPAALKPAIAKADAAFARLRQSLMTRLTSELAQKGPLTALSACHDSAQDIAREVQRSEGIALGRTSHRLRNAKNASPAWAAAHVKAGAAASGAEARALVVDLGERVGVLRPIPTLGMCTACHGPAEQLAPDIRETLAALYPSDQATGFRDGDLRGWMWAEVPK
jgi:hypothetical protein